MQLRGDEDSNRFAFSVRVKSQDIKPRRKAVRLKKVKGKKKRKSNSGLYGKYLF